MEATELFGRYHRLIRQVASRRADREASRKEIVRVMEQFRKDCLQLSPFHGRFLRDELLAQLEEEALHCADENMKAVFTIALKHLEADNDVAR